MKYLLIISLILLSSHTHAQSESTSPKGNKEVFAGNKAYDKGDMKTASALYQKALAINPKNDAARINLAIAQGKLLEADKSVSNFDAALNNKKNTPDLNAKLNYDKGVSLSKAKKYEDAVKAYENSLRINPGDKDARENLQKALNELKKQQDNQKQQNQNKQNQQQPKDKQQQQNKEQQNKEQQQQNQMSKQQAEQLLKALREQEKDTQKKLNEQKASGGIPKNGKDW
ncbi:MAG: tetratricopeptide repeat protein [Arachidicoccus sp.]|nr:tetratricopeptide repeat protein [Arachidicoccus sp.]